MKSEIKKLDALSKAIRALIAANEMPADALSSLQDAVFALDGAAETLEAELAEVEEAS